MPSIPVITSVPLSTSHPQSSQPQEKEISPPQRNAKGQFLPGNTESVGNEGGRPCLYCSNKDHYQKLTDEFMSRHDVKKEKPTMPFIEELALELDVDEDTVSDWAKKMNDGVREHPEFFRSWCRLNLTQKLRLNQRVMGRYNPTGAMFLLEVNHGAVRTSKQVVAGDKNEPLQIEIISEGAHHVE